ncbi:helix-turn-helix domain-containing protein [Micromonospora rifamycinica]|uniref:helix-turn-helix transcriptional regulator n=1 Tax=Micromonospora rifamycinica TaxID=291594 RepID=UPI002E2AF30A|nr:helix-turn-helix transcriptional regulator [Micromonospora rifamycinica]
MTGRPEKPLDPSAGPVAYFAFQLRRLRQEAGGPSYRTMASRTFYSVSALSIAAGGTRFPSWKCVEAYTRACGATDEDVAQWKRRWMVVRHQLQNDKRAAREQAKARAKAAASQLSLEAVQMHITMESRASLPVLDVRYLDADPDEVTSIEEFLIALDQMRVEKGLSLRKIAERSRLITLPGTEVSGGLTRSQLHEMLNGQAPLRPRHVLAYLLACGVPQERAALWLARLHRLRDQERRARIALTALKAHPSRVNRITTARTVTRIHPQPIEDSQIWQPPETAPRPPTDRGKHRQRRPWRGLLNWLSSHRDDGTIR